MPDDNTRTSRLFYGWPLLVIGFLIYGLGVSPAYYSWGFFAPEVIAELGLTRAQIGEVFGTFTLTYSAVSPLVAFAIARFGLRITVTAGALVAACGFVITSQAYSLFGFYVGFALIGGLGIGFSTILPVQVLCVNWFQRYRARATAVVMLGAAVVGAAVTPFAAGHLTHGSWRHIWLIFAEVSVGVALLSAIFIRNRPEDIGQQPDGKPRVLPAATTEHLKRATAPFEPVWTATQAIRSPQFAIATFAGLTATVSWRVLSAHGRLHFEDLGFTATVAAAILGVRVGTSAFGRLSASLADFLRPTRVLALALVINALGLGGLVVAHSAPLAYLCVTLLGVGFGGAYISESVVFADFFGRAAFAGTAGVRMAIVGVVGWIGPTWAGASADHTGSYTATLLVLMALCLAGSVAISFCPSPRLRSVRPAPAVA